jgi:hypothetical protein
MISDSFADLSENKGKTLQLFVAANKVMTAHLDTIDAESKPFYRELGGEPPCLPARSVPCTKPISQKKLGRT